MICQESAVPRRSGWLKRRRGLSLPAAAILAAVLMVGCASELISPEQAREKLYDQLSRAETARLDHRPKLENYYRENARRYRRLIETGETTTPIRPSRRRPCIENEPTLTKRRVTRDSCTESSTRR
jgi:hypothetical protein